MIFATKLMVNARQVVILDMEAIPADAMPTVKIQNVTTIRILAKRAVKRVSGVQNVKRHAAIVKGIAFRTQEYAITRAVLMAIMVHHANPNVIQIVVQENAIKLMENAKAAKLVFMVTHVQRSAMMVVPSV